MQVHNNKKILFLASAIVVIGIVSTAFAMNEFPVESQSASQELQEETPLKMVQTVHSASHEYPLDILAKGTKYAIVGKVMDITPVLSQFDEKTKMVFSDVTIQVERDLNGIYKDKEITVRIQGGEIDGYKTITDSNAEFELNERVLVFVPEKEPESIYGDNHIVAGKYQGKYSLSDGMAYGSHFKNGITESDLVSKIQQARGLN